MIIEYNGKRPQIAGSVFIAPNAVVIGDVIIKENASIWFGAVLRGDDGQIVVGPRVSVQDNSVIHVSPNNPTIIEAEATIGHLVMLEGCYIETGALVGMNATVLDGARIGAGALVAAGSVVREGQAIPPNILVAGVPAQVKGPISNAARQHMQAAPVDYQTFANNYKHLMKQEF